MKVLMKRILESLGTLYAYLCPKAFARIFLSFRNYLYTGYLRNRFAQMGDSVFEWKAQNICGERFIAIGDDNVFEPDLQLTAWYSDEVKPTISIGNHCLLRKGCHITAINRVTIGNHLLTGSNVLITDNTHGNMDFHELQKPPIERHVVSKGPVVIGDNVWLGNNVCVMPGVKIGDGVVIGANSVVTHDIPDYCLAVGCPAKVVR